MKTTLLIAASAFLVFLLNLQAGCVSSEWFSLSGPMAGSRNRAGKDACINCNGDQTLTALNTQKESVYTEQVVHHGQVVVYGSDPNDCLACHDGIVAPSVSSCTVECNFATSHSILKEYPPRLKSEFYAPIESLQEKGIQLFEGKVVCVSCHDLKITTRYHLIMDNGASTLCFSCHIT